MPFFCVVTSAAFWPGGLEGAHVQGKEFFAMSMIGFIMLFTFAK